MFAVARALSVVPKALGAPARFVDSAGFGAPETAGNLHAFRKPGVFS
jgi:hypothetical protein